MNDLKILFYNYLIIILLLSYTKTTFVNIEDYIKS